MAQTLQREEHRLEGTMGTIMGVATILLDHNRDGSIADDVVTIVGRLLSQRC